MFPSVGFLVPPWKVLASGLVILGFASGHSLYLPVLANQLLQTGSGEIYNLGKGFILPTIP
jgi:hypothetical protein